VADSGFEFERQSRKISLLAVTGLLSHNWTTPVCVGVAPAGPPLSRKRLPLVWTRPPKSKLGAREETQVGVREYAELEERNSGQSG